jgi:hypothetical protein
VPFYRDFHAKVKFPADYSRALEQFIGLFSNLVIHQVNATVIGVAAGTNNLQVSLGIEGLWRWINAEVQATHPGGAAASYDIVATTTANVFTTGTEEEEDHTNYNWALQIVPTGTIPSGGGIAATRKIGTLKWSGTAITAIEQVVPPVPLHASRHAIGGSDPLTPALIGAATTAQASALEAAYEDIDANTNGIYRSADFQFAPTINSASAELVAPSISGKAKINGVRTNTNPPIALGLIPPSLPASGQFMSVLIQIAAGAGGFGTAGVLSLVSGVAKATEAEALAAAPALSEKNMRIKEIIIKNTGGVYSIVATRDRRPWARGYYVNQALLITKAKTTAFVTLAQQRIEATQNVNVRANIPAVSATAGDVLTVRLSIDGSVAANSIRNYAFNSVAPMVIDYEAVIASNGGTQLVALECAISAEGSGHEVLFAGTFAGEGVVQMQESAANGLSSNGTT